MKTKLIAAFAAVMLLSGCSQFIGNSEISKAREVCKNNEGLAVIQVYNNSYYANCVNSAKFRIDK